MGSFSSEALQIQCKTGDLLLTMTIPYYRATWLSCPHVHLEYKIPLQSTEK